MPQIGAVEVDFSAGYAAPFVADAANSTISFQGPWIPTQPFVLSNSGGALPSPLQPATNYWIASTITPGVYTLTATLGGPAITLTDTGSGTNLVGAVPEGIRAWIKIRVGSLYQHREEMAAFDKTGKVMPLPFMDRLLDPYMVVF